MKTTVFILTTVFAAFLGAVLCECSTAKKITYEFPSEMLPHVKKENATRCEKGRVLYLMNCGGCHNYKKGRKELIPDFDPQQLQGYALRVSNAKHEQNMPDSLVSAEELGIIMTFLIYKKKNK